MRNTKDNQRENKISLIKQELNILLHGTLREEEWEYLQAENYIEEILNDFLSSSDVAEKVRQIRKAFGSRGVKRENAPHMLSEQEAKKPTGRLEALSLMVAEEATKVEEVHAFRTDVLGGN